MTRVASLWEGALQKLARSSALIERISRNGLCKSSRSFDSKMAHAKRHEHSSFPGHVCSYVIHACQKINSNRLRDIGHTDHLSAQVCHRVLWSASKSHASPTLADFLKFFFFKSASSHKRPSCYLPEHLHPEAEWPYQGDDSQSCANKACVSFPMLLSTLIQ